MQTNPIKEAETRGAREALTRLAETISTEGNGGGGRALRFRDEWYPAPTPAAPPPPTREWRVVVKNPRATAHVTLTFHPRECPSGPDEHIWHTHNADVREVRPLTAAQVEALAQELYEAFASAAPGEIPILKVPWIAAARAALAHLGIPYEEA